ncbi:hypothetical protein CAEBREN_03263 [Caenorhabditis brenneri]|uniref:Uncharacterized protein n=1 Tax=Caenorhabditis brenneri TaxID=135651 RepID=G0MGY1_CAEBE|nr:hypothetical protein CAEBREN_03263 [Caenorhabditis brenneri]
MDDLLGQHKQIVTGKNSSSYLIDGTYESWDGLFDSHYEIGYSVDFICTGAATSFDIRSLTIPDTQK